MSFQITTAFVNQFRDNVTLLSQQKGSRLRAAVRNETQNGEYEYFDQIGSASAAKVTNRHGDSPSMNTPHSRRRVGLVDYEYGDFVDKLDKVRTLIDPTSAYAQTAAFAMGRAMDDEIIAAFGGTAYTGVAGGTSTTFTAGMKIATGSGGLTILKLTQAKQLLDENENDPEEPRFIVTTSEQVTNLLSTTEIKSSDYNTVKALVKGEIDTFMGFKFLRSERLLKSSTTRYCYAWRQNAMLLSMGLEPSGKITERSDKRFSTYVYYMGSFGSTRMEETGVVEIACTETA